MALCAHNAVRWCNHWAWTFDPREKVATRPFDLFPRQEEFLLWMQAREDAGEDGVAEKSRDMGFTWCCCVYALHRWLYREGFSGGFGSRKEALVDKIGDPDSIFEKLRILLRNLPGWMLPTGFNWKRDDNFCKLINPANGSTITGEGGDNIGRGGRKSVYWVDEAAHLEHPQTIEAALSQTTRCRIWVSTPNGQGNLFYRKRFGGNVPVFTFHWRDDPRKDEAWYESEKRRIGDPVVIAQELDIDYSASVEGIVIPAAWVRAAVDLPLKVSKTYPLHAGLDVAAEGKNKNVLTGRRGPIVLQPLWWRHMNTTGTAHKAAEAARKMGAEVVHYDCVGVGAGVQGTWDSAETALGFTMDAINGGSAPTATRWPNGKTSQEMFTNLNAELYWILRSRFERAFEYVTQGIQHPHDEMISIPNDAALIADLSVRLYVRTETGKIQLESKKDLAKRGVASPDFADSLAYSFAPGRRVIRAA